MNKLKSKNAASVSLEFALFRQDVLVFCEPSVLTKYYRYWVNRQEILKLD